MQLATKRPQRYLNIRSETQQKIEAPSAKVFIKTKPYLQSKITSQKPGKTGQYTMRAK